MDLTKVTICRACGALLWPDAERLHQEFHREVDRETLHLRREVDKLTRLVADLQRRVPVAPVPTLKELGL